MGCAYPGLGRLAEALVQSGASRPEHGSLVDSSPDNATYHGDLDRANEEIAHLRDRGDWRNPKGVQTTYTRVCRWPLEPDGCQPEVKLEFGDVRSQRRDRRWTVSKA